MNDEDVLRVIEEQQDLMRRVATGQARIEDVDAEYRRRRLELSSAFKRRGIRDPNPHGDLWQWFSYWKQNFPSYQERRQYISALYSESVAEIERRHHAVGTGIFADATGWDRVDRLIDTIKGSLTVAAAQEEFQSVGLLCRETLISAAQEVFDPSRHVIDDVGKVSPTDAKRMLQAYFRGAFSGASNELVRRYAKTAVDLANELQHRRTATFVDAAVCAEATIGVVNIVAIIEGRRSRLG